MTKKKEDYSKTEVVFYISGIVRLTCGHLPNDQVYGYMDKSKADAKNTDLCAAYGFALLSEPCLIPSGTVTRQTLNITANRFSLKPLCKVRTTNSCIRNIKNGKCKDPFVIENIGKVFFADKYKDNNQR